MTEKQSYGELSLEQGSMKELQDSLALFGADLGYETYEADGKVYFQKCTEVDTDIFEIPTGVNVIGEGAFLQSCVDMVIVPKTVRKICTGALSGRVGSQFEGAYDDLEADLSNSLEFENYAWVFLVEEDDVPLIKIPDRVIYLRDQQYILEGSKYDVEYKFSGSKNQRDLIINQLLDAGTIVEIDMGGNEENWLITVRDFSIFERVPLWRISKKTILQAPSYIRQKLAVYADRIQIIE